MNVKINKTLYKMSKERYKGLLQIASEQVPFGIYAVEKNGYAELLVGKCKSMTELKEMIRAYKKSGWKVYQNGRK